MEVNSYRYDGKFEENILFFGQMACGKTRSYITLQKNRLFSKIKDVTLSKKREEI